MKALLAISIICPLIAGCYESTLPHSSTQVEVSVSLDNKTNPFDALFSVQFPHTRPDTLKWNFGDGFQAQGDSLEHNYSSPGMYQAYLEYEYQGDTFKKDVEVFIPGEHQEIQISSLHSFSMDSDHNDPNQPFLSNDINPQAIISPSTVSGILMTKNTCQAGRLCMQEDIIDRYEFNLNYNDEIQLNIIKGAINYSLTKNDESIIMQQTEQTQNITINPRDLGVGRYQLAITLSQQQAKAQYLIRLKQSTIKQERNYQPGKLIVMWHNRPVPELVDISDPRLESIKTNNLYEARKLFSQKSQVLNVSFNYYRFSQGSINPYDSFNLFQWPLVFQNINTLWSPITSRGLVPADNVTVAVLDTGIFSSHPNLQGLKTHSGYDFISDPVNAADGDGWDNDPQDPGDALQSFHGTHITGIIAAQPTTAQHDTSLNDTPNITGLAWGASIMPLRVLGINGGTSYDLIQALRYAAGLENQSGQLPIQPADVINLSLGGQQFSAAEQATIDEVINSGAIVVAAAGNQARPQVNFPAGYQNVIAVGALNKKGFKTNYSNYGPYLDVLAPGGECTDNHCSSGILSLGAKGTIQSNIDQRQAKWHNLAGTSMATAHVSALLAILRSHLPALDSENLKLLLTQNLINTDLQIDGHDNNTGWGQLSSRKIMELIDSSELSHAQVWATQKEFFLDKNEIISIQLTFRGEQAINPLQISYDQSQLKVSLHGKMLQVQAKTELLEPQTLKLSSNQNHELQLIIHNKATHNNSNFTQHLYLSKRNKKNNAPPTRASKQGDTWQANLSPIQPGEIIYASSDVDYDGVYCEPGEFCAILDSSAPNPSTLKISGDILKH